MAKQIVTAHIEDGAIRYEKGASRGSRKAFYVEGRATIYVKGSLAGSMYERLTLDLMRRVASIGLPVSELKRVGK